MSGSHVVRVLLVDDDPALVQEYRHILRPGQVADETRPFARLEGELFGTAASHKRFPAVDLTAQYDGRAAVEAVRASMAESRPFALAFIDLALSSDLDGVQTAERIRAVDRDVQIVLVGARPESHPVELAERVPPADRLFFVKKPFHSFEIQQFLLALSARWRGERPIYGQVGAARAQATLTDTLDRLPAGVMVFDRRDRLLVANEAMGVLFPELAALFAPGTTYEEIQREMAERLLPEGVLVRVDAWVADRMDWHARGGGVIEQRLRAGRWALVVEGTGATGDAYCMYVDITELKRREAGRASAAHMTQLAQSFAALCDHLERLAPAVVGRNRTAGSRRRAPDIAVLPGAAASAPGGMDGLKDRLLAIAQRQKLVPGTVGLNRLVGDLVRRIRAEMPPGVEAEVITGAGLWPVALDTEKFGAALIELVRNAYEAMPTGGRLVLETANIRLTREFAGARPGLAAGEYIRLSVQDTGPGMAPELAERALNPFFTSKGQSDHLGLGLSTAYGFVGQSGGYMDIDGGPGRGVTIDLYFPRAEEAATEPRDDAGTEEVPAARRAGTNGGA